MELVVDAMSDDEPRPHPHDRLVRDTLAIPENAVSVLSAALPAKVLAQMDLSTLRAEPGTFVDRAGESRTDLLFSVRMGGHRALVYVLLEHQSQPDPEMPLRMLVYMGRIWQSLRASGRKRLPVIVPVVLHHGATGWAAPRRLGELLDWDEATREALSGCVPDFELLVDDLAKVPERELLRRAGAPLGRLVVWVLRVTRTGFDPALAERWIEVMNQAEATGDREAFRHVVAYLLGTDEGTEVFEALSRGALSAPVGRWA